MNSSSKNNKNKSKRQNSMERNKLLPTLIAAGSACSLVAGPAGAMELGELQVESALGQPLRASIAYALNPNEQIGDFCIFLKPGTAESGLTYLSRATVSVGTSSIVFSGSAPIREPMLAMHVSVDCPYTARLAREYTLMFSPAAPTEAAATLRPAPVVAQAPAAAVTRERPQRRRVPVNSAPIAELTYEVQRGDTLSEIASRISDRKISLWPAVNAIFAANPEAFVDNDVNRLKAGSVLRIPDAVHDATATVAQSSSTVSAAPTAISRAYEGIDVSASTADQSSGADDSSVLDSATAQATAAADIAETAASQEADGAAANDDNPFVTTTGTTATTAANPAEVVIPDTQVAEPVRPAPVVVSGSSQGAESGSSWNWLFWLGGAGLALIAALLLFGRRIRGRMAPTPIRAFDEIDDADEQTIVNEDISSGVDHHYDESAIEEVTMSLDADLGLGTGLQPGPNIVGPGEGATIEDSNTAPQIQLTIPPEDASDRTDIIPALGTGENTILESEIPPSDETGEYDLSMIVDATKQAIGDMEHTAMDLMAVPRDSQDEADGTDVYTLSKEVDYKILEQDYEEELTQTQALNAEIAQAALELAEHMDAEDSIVVETAEVPTVNEEITLEGGATAEVPALELDDSLLGATSEMPVVEAEDPDATAEVPLAGVDDLDLDETQEAPLSKEDRDMLDATSDMLVFDDPAVELEATTEMPLVEAKADESELAKAFNELDETAHMPVPQDLTNTVEITSKRRKSKSKAKTKSKGKAGSKAKARTRKKGKKGAVDDNLTDDDMTAVLPQTEDGTIEMEVESGTVDTKSIKVS